MDKLVTIARYDNAIRAQIIQERFLSEGIPCIVNNLNMGINLPGIIRIDLKVRSEDVMQAKHLLNAIENQATDE